jgi:cation-transporting P-type ATPase I
MVLFEWRRRITEAWAQARVHRRAWSGGPRAYVEVRGPDQDGFAEALREALEAVPGVAWAQLNPAIGRVVIGFTPTSTSTGTSGPAPVPMTVTHERLIAIVDALEREYGLEPPVGWVGRRAFPGDSEPPLRSTAALTTDAIAFGLSATMRALGVETASAQLDLAALISLLEHVPQVRERIVERFGPSHAELGLHLASSVSTVLIQGLTGPIVDAIAQTLRLREHAAHAEAWVEFEAAFASSPEAHASVALDGSGEPRERPGPAPRGPIEHYTSRALAATAGAFGFGFVASRNLAGSTASVFGGVPKPALAGREAFAAELGQRFASRGIVVMDPAVLRRLDRVGAVVVAAELMRPGGVRVEGIVAVNGFHERDARRNAMRMLDMSEVTRVREDGPWRLAPIGRLSLAQPSGIADAIAEQIASLRVPGGVVLGLEHHGALAALVSLIPMPDPALERFLAAVRRAGLVLVCAGEPAPDQRWIAADRSIPGGDRLLDGIQTLQRDGHGVCLIVDEASAALAAADVGLGLCTPGSAPPWGAAILGQAGLADAEALIDAIHVARSASEQSVYLAMVEAVSSLILAVAGIRERTVRRVMMAANTTAGLAMLNGVRLARTVDGQRPRPSADSTPWHALEPDQVLARLHSSNEGLRPDQAAERQRSSAPITSPWARFGELMIDELATPFAPVLVAGAGLSALTGSVVDALLIVGVVSFNAGLGAVQRYRTDQAIAALDASESQPTRVRRAGVDQDIELDALVLGDVLVLEAGDSVPADARILVAEGLELDESSLTGESLPISKRASPSFAAAVADRTSMVFEGTSVAAGRCLAVVTAVADDTEARRGLGRQQRAPTTGVEARLESLTNLTAPIAALAGLTLMSSGLSLGRPAAEVISSGVSLAVAAVPEGLPLLATMAQLGAARRLSARGALVRNPRAVEALGRVDVLCADKTGTLTEGRIRLRLISDGEREARIEALREARIEALREGEGEGEGEPGAAACAGLRELLRVALRASPSASVDELPHMTDRALIEGAHACGLHRSDDREFERISELPFEPGRGYHAVHGRVAAATATATVTAIATHEPNGVGDHLILKGAPERVIPLCTRRVRGDGGQHTALDDDARERLLAASEALAGRGLRVLAVAERRLAARERIADRHVVELSFRGFVAFADPVRDTAKQAVEAIHKAGVSVVMITGDHPNTARAIAAELGLIAMHAGEGEVMTGAELDVLDDATLDARIEQVAVFARVTPAQKVRLVRSFQRLGRVVAMTGDGANDAPAIRLADVGVALGQRATPAARRAADVVVTDERIETLVDAVLEGRALWRSVRDAVALLVGGNLGEVAFTVLAGLVEGRSPLNARQLLLVNILTDTAPALAIALRRPPESKSAPEQLLREGPESSLGQALDRDIAWRAAVTAGATTASWLVARVTGSRKRADTVALLTLVGSQLGQTLAIGGRDPTVLAAGLSSTALLFGLVETPFVSQFFGSRPVGPIALGQAVAASAVATGVAVAGPPVLAWVQRRRAARAHS